jgi:hypothetical protein
LTNLANQFARKDYDDRRRRQAQGIAKMKAEGKATGRPEDTERNARIATQLRDGVSWSTIQKAEDCSRSTIFKVHKRMAVPTVAWKPPAFASSSMKPSLGCGSFEVRYADGRESIYFYWDDIPARRMRPETLDRETALEKAKAVAKAAQSLE